MKRNLEFSLLFALGIAAALGGSTTGCSTDAYCFACEAPEAGGGVGGTGGSGGGTGGSGGSIIVPDGGGGDPGDADAEAACETGTIENCGSCGDVCQFEGAFARCDNGVCVLDECAPGFVDRDGDGLSCECEQTAGGVELCDGADNDCNGTIDDGFDTTSDLEHCGGCNSPCADLPNSTKSCVNSQCEYTCLDGFGRPGGTTQQGCAYQCPVWPTEAETCDGEDDDCDGAVDEDQPGGNVACSDHCPNGLCQGQCTTGLTACTGTATGLACIGGIEPSIEACDGADNDCDGVPDNGFDFQNDPLHCGNCVTQCQSGDLCVAGQCIFTCGVGFKDLDGSPANGCEYACPVFPEEVETCDGEDDNCDGVIDDAPTDVGGACVSQCPAVDPCVTAGDCSPFTIAGQTSGCYGVCAAGGTFVCLGGVRTCDFPSRTLVDDCDGADNNCNGVIDEGFDLQTDPFNCGGCGDVCTAPNTQAMTCAAGSCSAIAACTPGFADLNGTLADGCEYTCPVNPPVGEVCNNQDDDCDGDVDNNPNNIGSACAAGCPTVDSCVAAGNCTETVSPNINNCYGVCAADGITICTATGSVECDHPQQSAETCNGQDDDCDGRVDDGFNVQTDTQNCGACGNVCNLPAVTTHACVAGVCEVAACDAGFADIDGQPSNGCEYACPSGAAPGNPETCDGVDNDCDGQVDDTPTGVGVACQSSCPGGVCRGICTAGTTTCVGGTLACSGGVPPTLEVCNSADDDCDGTVDNGFNLQTNPLHCGACNNACSFANAIAGCTAGSCTIAACNAGFANLDGNLANGCEHTCEVYPTSAEVCNGKDDDCDNLVDAADPGFQTVSLTCIQTGVCAGAVGVCTGANGWRCNYKTINPNIQVDPTTGALAVVETLCDGFDNNCNTQIDETFPQLGTACSVGVGECAGTSTYSCSTDKLSVTCNTTANATAARDELCNGLDDNCDGQVDERVPTGTPTCYDAGGTNPHPCTGWRDQMVQVGAAWVYAYEATRPDASDQSLGALDTRACSRPGALPWTSVTRADAVAACAAVRDSAGNPMRLCEKTEWEAACLDGRPLTPISWSYTSGATTYTAGTCNDANASPVGSWVGGNNASCASVFGGGSIFDLSGNVAEWTNTCDVTVGGVTYCRIRGGSTSTLPEGTSCGFDFVVQQPSFRNFDLGFRCCSDAAP